MQDIELIQQLGRLSWVRLCTANSPACNYGFLEIQILQSSASLFTSLLLVQVTESAREDPLQVSRNTVEQQTAVIAFKGQYYSGLPFQVSQSSLALGLHLWKTKMANMRP